MHVHDFGKASAWVAILCLILICGCGDGRGGGGGGGGGSGFLAELDPAVLDVGDSEMIEAITQMSAPNVFAAGMAPLFAADLATNPDLGRDTSCPAKTDNGDGTVTYTGDCTTAEGKMWLGTATGPAQAMDGPPATSGRAEYDGFGWEGPSECATMPGATQRLVFDGTMTFSGSASGVTFETNTVVTGHGIDDDCEAIDARAGFSYVGSMAMVEDGGTSWDGSGSTGSERWGRFEARTEGELLNMDVCGQEALAGRTTVEAGSDVVVITYDGATDCEENSTVQWSLNGDPQGELQGVTCAVGSGASPPGWLGAIVLLAAARLLRRGAHRRKCARAQARLNLTYS